MEMLLPQHILDEHLAIWFKEDMPNLDYGGLVIGLIKGNAHLLCKSKGILCGSPFVSAAFKKLNCQVNWFFKEGDMLEPICVVAEVSGNVKDILLG